MYTHHQTTKMNNTKEIKVKFKGKGYKVNYKVETIDINTPDLQFVNVYSVFIDDEELQKVIGDHFTVIHNNLHVVKPVYEIKSSGDIDEVNLKKEIAHQVMNNPTE